MTVEPEMPVVRPPRFIGRLVRYPLSCFRIHSETPEAHKTHNSVHAARDAMTLLRGPSLINARQTQQTRQPAFVGETFDQ